MSTDLALLSALAPPWAARVIDARGGAGSVWLAAPPLPSGARIPGFTVRIRSDDGFLEVSEFRPTRLPAACPELHVNGDGSFCIGRSAFDAADAGEVAEFWQALGEYLVNQHHATRRGFWPAGRWLSHGSAAADRQVEAEKEAARLGWSDEYSLAIENGEGWLAGDLPVHAGTGKVISAGTPCPRGCRDAQDDVVPLRRCAHRAGVSRLIAAEAARREAQGAYIEMLRRAGRRCCGRIARCPLGSDREAA